MVDGLRPYPEYKDSGVPWLGRIPSAWQVRSLRRSGTILGGLTPSMGEPAFWGGSIPWVTPKDMKSFDIQGSLVRVSDAALDRTGLKLLPPGSVLLVVRGMILARRVPIGVTSVPVTINQDMKALVPFDDVHARFLAYAMEAARDAFSPHIDEAGHGTRRLPTSR